MKRLWPVAVLVATFMGVIVPLALIGLDAWNAWEPDISLDVRADRSAVVCAACAVPGLVLLAFCALKLHRIEKGLRP